MCFSWPLPSSKTLFTVNCLHVTEIETLQLNTMKYVQYVNSFSEFLSQSFVSNSFQGKLLSFYEMNL